MIDKAKMVETILSRKKTPPKTVSCIAVLVLEQCSNILSTSIGTIIEVCLTQDLYLLNKYTIYDNFLCPSD